MRVFIHRVECRNRLIIKSAAWKNSICEKQNYVIDIRSIKLDSFIIYYLNDHVIATQTSNMELKSMALVLLDDCFL